MKEPVREREIVCMHVCMYLIDGDGQLDEAGAELEALRVRREELEQACAEGSEEAEALRQRACQLERDLAASSADQAELESAKAAAAAEALVRGVGLRVVRYLSVGLRVE